MIARVTFKVASHHHLSTPWHLNLIEAKTTAEAEEIARSYMSRENANGIYRYDLEILQNNLA